MVKTSMKIVAPGGCWRKPRSTETRLDSRSIIWIPSDLNHIARGLKCIASAVIYHILKYKNIDILHGFARLYRRTQAAFTVK